MNLLLICEQFGVHEKRFAKAFSKRGHHVKPALTLESGRIQNEVLSLCRSSVPHHVILGGPLHRLCGLSALKNHSPFIGISYAYDVIYLAKHSEVDRMRIRQTLSKCDGLITDCKEAEEAARLLLPNFNIPTCVKPWGLDKEDPPFQTTGQGSPIRELFGWGNDKIIISTRRLTRLHGVETVVAAFLELARTQKGIRLLIVGDGELEENIRRTVAASACAEKVGFTGFVPESKIPLLLEQADLYVSASMVDGISISMLQALDAGLPVALSDVGGNREWKERLHPSLYFPPNDAPALCRIMQHGLNSFCRTPGQWSELLNAEANWRKNADAIVSFVESVVSYKLCVKY
jgi:glycosyltransferase involved in cell wall biosynthesis